MFLTLLSLYLTVFHELSHTLTSGGVLKSCTIIQLEWQLMLIWKPHVAQSGESVRAQSLLGIDPTNYIQVCIEKVNISQWKYFVIGTAHRQIFTLNICCEYFLFVQVCVSAFWLCWRLSENCCAVEKKVVNHHCIGCMSVWQVSDYILKDDRMTNIV